MNITQINRHSKDKILIIGGSGLLGVNWALLKRFNYDITIGINNRLIQINHVTSMRLDTSKLTSIENALEKINPDIVINAAGLTNVESCEENVEHANFVNIELSKMIAILCNKHNIKMVQISTDHITNGLFPYFDELSEPFPLNNYANTKLIAEKEVLNVCPNALVIRTNFYGWGPRYRKSFSDFIISNLRDNKPIKLFTDVYFTPIIICELVETIHELLAKKLCGIFNVVGDERISKFMFGKKIAQIFLLNENLILPDSFTTRKDLVNRPLDMSLSNKKASLYLNKKIGSINDHLIKLREQETIHLKEISEL